MKKGLSLFAVSLILLAVGTGCGSTGASSSGIPPTPTPVGQPAPPATDLGFAFLRNDSSVMTISPQQRQADRIAAKLSHGYQGASTVDPVPANIYVWPFTVGKNGWWFGSERKITAQPAAYTSVHLSLNGITIVFSETVRNYNQIFISRVVEGKTLWEPTQLTTDTENHWIPHISADGSKVVFTKSDPNSSGDVVCVINNTARATEDCLDFSSTTPVLKGAKIWHASWSPQGKIVFEAWDGPLSSDEIFMVNVDGSGLTQITNNAGTQNYDECPSIFGDGKWMAVDTWNNETQYFEIMEINLDSKERRAIASGEYMHADAWDPLQTPYSTVWVSQLDTDKSLELYIFTYSPTRMTNNSYADYFESNAK